MTSPKLSKIEDSKPKYGDRIREIADQLKQERQIQIQATSRILGAAAQIAQNHDRLIDEVSEMVQEDLEKEPTIEQVEIITIDQLKQQFKTLNEAKQHFNLTANSWKMLVDRLNAKSETSPLENQQPSVTQRLDSIEKRLTTFGNDLTQIMNLLTIILEKGISP